MTPANLRKLGLAIWGRSWAAELAAALGVHHVTVKRWAAGLYAMGENDERRLLDNAVAWSETRHKAAKKLVRSYKLSFKHRMMAKTFKVEPTVFIPPWKKFTKRRVILEDF